MSTDAALGAILFIALVVVTVSTARHLRGKRPPPGKDPADLWLHADTDPPRGGSDGPMTGSARDNDADQGDTGD